ncbi:hypothetical protein O1R50_24235 [Glycomyces luteolus]|uniref:Uncharacterized protein n=1 Tax=Glycomyces luteolus TaxID=2670330 RepID=A0A9X3PHP2_9ACTN|nr:hypothetical protein [Glycomyces luteolus]MDA1362749.1 hypothetical protein [Glycomyces luteolus]
MNRAADPVLPRMPGSAILAVVFLGLQAIVAVGGGVALLPLIPAGLALLLIAGGLLNTAIAIGIGMRRPWARITGIVLCAAAITLGAVDLLLAAAEGVPSTGGAGFGLSILLLFFLSHRNTRAWCNDLDPAETALGPAEPELLTYQDRVELRESIDDIGLRAHAVGRVVDLPPEPRTVVVEFDDHPDREPIRVTLHVDEIRLVAEAE